MPLRVDPRVPSTTLRSSTLAEGASGTAVKAMQTSLVKLGFADISPDGKFGPKTEGAVKRFQTAMGLTADGLAGTKTLESMKRAVTSGFNINRRQNPADNFAPTAPTGAAGASASTKINHMLTWAKSKLGTPYASVNPFRFGNVPWDGQPHRSENGSSKIYNFPRGTKVFDCSGFVCSAFKSVGVDLAAKGLTTTRAFHNDTTHLRPVQRQDIKPGDLIMYQPHNGVGHVVIYQGNGRCIESSGSRGVKEGPVDWSRLKSIRRVPV